MIEPTQEQMVVFVQESNAIEGIVESVGHPLFDDHMSAALRVVAKARSGDVLSPTRIHAQIMRSESDRLKPGRLRMVDVGIRMADGRVYPKMPWHLVQAQFRQLGLMAHGMRQRIEAGEEPPGEEDLWELHHRFEWIHPFPDGNGRTGRLWLNALRLVSGWPWLTVYASAKARYYAEIRDWERGRGW